MSHIKNIKAVRAIYEGSGKLFTDFVNTIKSLLFITFLSSVKYIKSSKNLDNTKSSKDCIVLGNGPSLKKAFAENEIQFDKMDVLCVNLFCMSEFFWQIKPRYYLLIDNAFFGPKWDSQKNKVNFMKDVFKKTDWPMYLVIPCYAANGGLLADLDNPNITIVKLNTARFDGFKSLRNFVYKTRLGMPECQNVTNFAICAAVNMGYQRINLYGADFSWMKDMHVNDENIMCQGEAHVYDDKKVCKETQFIGYKISQVCKAWSNAFYIHEILNEYANSRNQTIVNRTRGSYIDAYQRDYNF
jgi:hypothetical protein